MDTNDTQKAIAQLISSGEAQNRALDVQRGALERLSKAYIEQAQTLNMFIKAHLEIASNVAALRLTTQAGLVALASTPGGNEVAATHFRAALGHLALRDEAIALGTEVAEEVIEKRRAALLGLLPATLIPSVLAG